MPALGHDPDRRRTEESLICKLQPPMAHDLPYKSDLAYIHDVGFADIALHAAPVISSLLKSNGIADGLVVELGCGSGLSARKLIDAGYDVLGIDLSEGMLAIARNRVPEATFRQQSFLNAEIPPCSAVTAIGECFNYLFDERHSIKRLIALFERVYAALSPRGLFIFDVAEPGYGKRRRQRHFEQHEDWTVLVSLEEDAQARLTRSITTFRKWGSAYRRDDEVHRLQLLKAPELAKELRRIGFRVRLRKGYGQLRFRQAHVALLCQK